MRYCTNCGNQNDDNIAFCINCGNTLQQNNPPPPPPVYQEPVPPTYITPPAPEPVTQPVYQAPPEPEPEPEQDQQAEPEQVQQPQPEPQQQVQPEPEPQAEPETELLQPVSYQEIPEPQPQLDFQPQPEPYFIPQTSYVQAYQPQENEQPAQPPPPYVTPAYAFEAPKKSGAGFIQNGLGFIAMGVILLFIIGLVVWEALTTGLFTSLDRIDIDSILNRYFIFAIIAIFTVVATRIKGPDFSAPFTMVLATAFIAAVPGTAGIVIAVAVCLLIGCFNGTIIILFNAPAIIVTLITSAIIYAVLSAYVDAVADGSWLMPWVRPDISQDILSYIGIGAAVVLAFGTLAFTRRLLKPKPGRKTGILSKSMDILGYGFVALIACIAGYLMANRTGWVTIYQGEGYVVYILIIFFAVQSAGILKNGMLSLLYGLIVAAVITVGSVAMQMLDFTYEWQEITHGIIALILLCTACIVQGGWRGALGANLSE